MAGQHQLEYFSFPSIDGGGASLGDGSSYTLPRLLGRFRTALGGASSSSATAKDNRRAAPSSARPHASSSRVPFPTLPEVAEAEPVASSRAPSSRGAPTLDDDFASDAGASAFEGVNVRTGSRAGDPLGRRNAGFPYSLSNASQTPSIGLSPISTSVLQQAMSSAGWPAGVRGGQLHSFQYPRPHSVSSRNTAVVPSLARVPQSPAHSTPELPTGSDLGQNFSHVPGFPLSYDLAADDAGSIISVSTRVPAHQTSEAASRLFRKMQGVGLSKDYWMPDEDAKECYDCASRFTAWRRKHHCRVCGQIFCSTCASNLISGDRLWASGYIRVCNICFARLNTDDDAMSEAPEPDLISHPLASSWTPSLSSLRILPSHARKEPAEDPRPETRRTPRRCDYIVHERDLSGDLVGSWPVALGGDAPSEPSPNLPPAPFRPAIAAADDDQPATAPSPAPESSAFDAADIRRRPSEAGEEQPAAASADGPTQSTPLAGQGDPAHAGGEGSAPALDDEEAVEAASEDAESPAHTRARVISRPLLPRMASREPPELYPPESEAEPRIPAPSTRKELPGNEAELTPAAFGHLRLMVRQALERELVPGAEAWEDELLWLLAKVSRYPAPNVAAGEPSDVRRIVKIKAIPGGRPTDCEYVSGVVCTKNVLHKKMPRLIANPRVMLLDFSLDYERVEGRLTKLETLLTQEKTWLRSNVDKVLKVRPSVLLVQGNVPGYAIDLFVSAGVAVARNLRPELVQAIARVTQTSVNSMDKLAARPAYGQCGLFQVQTFAHSLIPGFKKTFLRFEGCPPELGATLVLRGADLHVLKRIKAIANVMVRVAYSLKLESYYLRDEGVFFSRAVDEAEARGQNAAAVIRHQQTALQSVGQDEKTADELSLAETVVAPYETLVFSSSPSVSIRPPIALTELRSTLVAIRELHHRRDEEEANQILREETGIKDATDPEKHDPTFTLLSASDVGFASSLAALDVRRQGQTQVANAFLAGHQTDFDVSGHQKVVVQESVTRRSDGKLCRGHQLRELQFYHPGEPTIGQTIHALVASCLEPCPTKGCGETKQAHRTHYSNSDHEVVLWVHHQLNDPIHPDEVDATLEPGNESLILMESFCPVCDGFTLKTKMSDDSWRLSFGKFLELCFHSPGLYAKTMVRHDTGAHVSCTHDAHLSHARHFFHRGYRVDILVRRTSVFDVHLPPTRLWSAPQTQLRLRNDEFSTIEARTRLYFDSVRARLATLNPELAAIERQEKCRELLTTLGSNAEADEKQILGKLESAYDSSAGTNGLLLNSVRKMLVDKAVSWDAEFTSLELAFLSPADKDVRRLTSMQIRKLFVDATVSSSPERPANSAPPSIAEPTDEAEHELESPQSPLIRALQLPDSSDLPLPDLPSASNPPDSGSTIVAGERPELASEERETTLHDQPSGASTPSISGDKDESAGSDSTVTGAEGRSTYHRFARESGPDESPSTLSDTDPPSDHGLPVIATRSRRVRQPAGIAQLVQRFDGSDSGPPASAAAPKTTRTVSATSQRPGYRRGKSEGLRVLKRQSQKEHGSVSDNILAEVVGSSGVVTASSSRDGNNTTAPSSKPMMRPTKSAEGRSMPDGRRGTVKRTRSIGTSHRRAEAGESPEAGERPGTLSRTGSISGKPRALDLKGKDSLRRPRPDSVQSTAAWSPPRRPGLNPSGHSKVTAIARHFDRLSREAESDRSRRTTRGRRARPIAQAQSSVHAFSSVRAAMREDSDDEDDADDEEEGGPSGLAVPEDAVGPTEAVSDLTELSQSPKSSVDAPAEPTREDAPSEQAPVRSPVAAISRSEGLSSVPASPLLSSDGFAAASRMLNPLSESEVSSSDTTSRNSIMKTLSAFWSYRGADLIPLQYPHLPTEHQSAENLVVIREDEPTSIIAFTLASRIYRETLESEKAQRANSIPSDVRRAQDFERPSLLGGSEGQELANLDDPQRSSSAQPIQFRHDLGPCTATCKVFWMHQFESLRDASSVSRESFIQSLSRCVRWDSAGGKSGQLFLKTIDDMFIIKGISKVELEGLTKFAPTYFDYVTASQKNQRPSALAKIYGIFQISFVNKSSGKKAKLQVQVLENLLAETRCLEKEGFKIFDLKGLTRNRTVAPSGRNNEVLLDGNFIEMCRAEPVLVHETALLQLQAALFNDTAFLASCNHMDYSLVVGFDPTTRGLHVGIIDYLTPYGFNKRLETLVKELGGTSKEAPTVITPMLYKARFRSAMARYFTLSPDFWTVSWTPLLSKDSTKDPVEAKAGGERYAVFRKVPVFGR